MQEIFDRISFVEHMLQIHKNVYFLAYTHLGENVHKTEENSVSKSLNIILIFIQIPEVK